MIHRYVFAGILGLVFLEGASLIVGSFVSYDAYCAYIDTLSIKYYFGPLFTLEYYTSMIGRLRIVGASILALAVTITLFRRWFLSKLSGLGTSFGELWNDFIDHLATVWREDRLYVILVGVFTIIGLAMRIVNLDLYMRNDEAHTFSFYATQPWYVYSVLYLQPNNQILHTHLVHFSTTLFGNVSWAIRLPVLIAGTLLIPSVFIMVRKYSNSNIALVTSGFIATAHTMILYSVIARGYIIITSLFIINLTLMFYLRTHTNVGGWFFFTGITVLSAYAVPTALYPIAITYVWYLLSVYYEEVTQPKSLQYRYLFTSAVAAVITTLLLYAPPYAYIGSERFTQNDLGYPYLANWDLFISGLKRQSERLLLWWHEGIPAIGIVTLGVGVIASQIRHSRIANTRVSLVAAVIVALVPILLYQRVFAYARVWLFLFPIYVMLAFAGLSIFFKFNKIYSYLYISISILLISIVFIPSPFIKYFFDLLAPDGDAANVVTPSFIGFVRRNSMFGFVFFVGGVTLYLVERYVPPAIRKRMFFSISATMIVAFQGIYVTKNQTILRSPELGTFRDAEAITLFLKDNIEKKDDIVFGDRIAWTFEYYLIRSGIDIRQLRRTDSGYRDPSCSPYRVGEPLSGRFFIVTRNGTFTVTDILTSLEAEPSVDLDGFGEPVLVKEFPESKIYQMTRQTALTPEDTSASDR